MALELAQAMEITQHKDVEKGNNKPVKDLEELFISKNVNTSSEIDQNGSIKMARLSTAVAIYGSLEFGMCVGLSAPAQSAICDDLNLSVAEYSLFGSIITIGAAIGAVTSGRIEETIGRKGGMALGSVICIEGWLAICLAMGSLLLDTGRFFTGYGLGIFTSVKGKAPVTGSVNPRLLNNIATSSLAKTKDVISTGTMMASASSMSMMASASSMSPQVQAEPAMPSVSAPRFVKLWEGELFCRKKGQLVLVSRLKGYREGTSLASDITGANKLVDPNGRVKLADFGMEKHVKSVKI